jgi:hypothetical protein
LNGEVIGTGSYTGGITGNSDVLYISYADSTYDFPGFIDEVRISDTDRDADWIKTSYNNQHDPIKSASCDDDGFVCLGSEESDPPTAVKLRSFTVTSYPDGVLLRWRTGWEVDNLGFHVYREVGGEPVRLTPSLIAGSALLVGPNVSLTAGRSYGWFDPAGMGTDRYWLEDIDLNGQRTMHGPVLPHKAEKPLAKITCSPLLSRLGRTNPARDLAACLGTAGGGEASR